MLMNKQNINEENLVIAIKNTFKNRNTEFNINKFKEIISLIKDSKNLKNVYFNYQEKLEYTKNVSFDDTINSINKIIAILEDK